MGYGGYCLPIVEVVTEGSVWLMNASSDSSSKGLPTFTYAMWWISGADLGIRRALVVAGCAQA